MHLTSTRYFELEFFGRSVDARNPVGEYDVYKDRIIIFRAVLDDDDE